LLLLFLFFSFLDVITARAPGIRVVAISIPCHTAIHCFPRALRIGEVFVVRWIRRKECRDKLFLLCSFCDIGLTTFTHGIIHYCVRDTNQCHTLLGKDSCCMVCVSMETIARAHNRGTSKFFIGLYIIKVLY